MDVLWMYCGMELDMVFYIIKNKFSVCTVVNKIIIICVSNQWITLNYKNNFPLDLSYRNDQYNMIFCKISS
jgi:hypothetical protein